MSSKSIEIDNKEYFEFTRKEILPLLPEKFDKILEIGCGNGNTLEWIKSIKGCKWIAGIELIHNAAANAKKKLNACYEGNIETMKIPFKDRSIDVILCLDVLEHLVDPWAALKRLIKLLKPGGVIISSIPNIQHYTISIPFIFKGKWDYAQAGILDKTHLRFFVKNTAIDLMKSSGLEIDSVIPTYARKEIEQVLVKILPNYIRRFFEYQYLIKSKNVNR